MEDLFTASVNRDHIWEMSHFHFHDHYEILLVTAGTCSFMVEAEMLQATRGTILIMENGTLHMSTSLPNSEYSRYVIGFRAESLKHFESPQTPLLQAFRSGSHFIQLTEEEMADIEPLFRRCEDMGEAYGTDLRRNTAFLEILVRLGELVAQDRSALPAPETEESRNYRRMKPLITYILEHPTEQLSLDTVAEKFYFNKHYLCRLFKEATGISVGKYITSVRIQYSTMLLRRGYSVQESGAMTGFRNNSNYISTFHKVMDNSPGQYRLQCGREVN